MSKGTASMGQHGNGKSHVPCRRCGSSSYHIKHKACSRCGYGYSAKLRSFAWQKKSLVNRRKV